MASLILQATYDEIQFALYKNEELLSKRSVIKTQSSYFLMNELNKVLHKESTTWSELAFIGVNQGPAPFTTLRALIATVNGIAFATGVGLIGVDGLVCFADEQYKQGVTVVLLNAFAQDVYYAVKEGDTIKTGWQNSKEFLECLKGNHPDQPITFVGNGVPLHQEKIEKMFGECAFIPTPLPQYPKLDTVAQHCFGQIEKVPHLTPLYLKTQQYKPSC